MAGSKKFRDVRRRPDVALVIDGSFDVSVRDVPADVSVPERAA
jgi:hypothetical protein